MRLTERDEEMLHALVTKVRLFSLRQIADHWWFGDVPNARRRIKLMDSEGFVERISVRSRSLPDFSHPVSSWKPGDAEPGHGAVAHALQSRWNGKPVRESSACVASSRTEKLFGGKRRGKLKSPLQATHDLGVAAVWLKLHADAPDWAEAWRGEDLLAHTRVRQKLPDSFIVDNEERVVSVIEFGGSYDTERVAEFHRDCCDRDLPYQIW